MLKYFNRGSAQVYLAIWVLVNSKYSKGLILFRVDGVRDAYSKEFCEEKKRKGLT